MTVWCGQRQKISRGKGQELHPCCSADSTDDSASAAATATSLRRRREAAWKGFAFCAAAPLPRQEADLQGPPRAPCHSPLVPPLRRRLSIDDGVPALPLSSACRARWRRSRGGRSQTRGFTFAWARYAALRAFDVWPFRIHICIASQFTMVLSTQHFKTSSHSSFNLFSILNFSSQIVILCSCQFSSPPQLFPQKTGDRGLCKHTELSWVRLHESTLIWTQFKQSL